MRSMGRGLITLAILAALLGPARASAAAQRTASAGGRVSTVPGGQGWGIDPDGGGRLDAGPGANPGGRGWGIDPNGGNRLDAGPSIDPGGQGPGIDPNGRGPGIDPNGRGWGIDPDGGH